MEQVIQHIERFDLTAENSGRLIDTEHRGRYWWASHIVVGKEVLDAGCGVGYGVAILSSAGAKSVAGVDIDPTAVSESKENLPEQADSIVQGDLGDLPFPDQSFDVVVCFEVLEHLEDSDRALAEFRRVLRQNGILIVSSPNPDVYVSGNEYHFHEFRPNELIAAVTKHFTHTAGYRQHAYLASTIEPASTDSTDVTDRVEHPELRRTTTAEAGKETYGIVVAGNEELPLLDSIVSLGEAFEVAWWSEQVANHAREASHAVKRLQETSTALVNANQELAQIPLLQHRIAALQEAQNEIVNSRSWRLTALLRHGGLRRLLRRR